MSAADKRTAQLETEMAHDAEMVRRTLEKVTGDDKADLLLEQHAIVKLTHGSTLNWKDFQDLNKGLQEMQGEIDRARRLAAKLEEVVAMRNTVLAALIEMNPDDRFTALPALQAWAKAQLSEVP